MTYKLQLLTTGAFGSLTRMEQSLALDVARHAGMRAALAEESADSLARPSAHSYYQYVIEPAAEQGFLAGTERARWERACRNGAEQEDPRVRVFLLAWRERARELVPSSPEVEAQRGAA